MENNIILNETENEQLISENEQMISETESKQVGYKEILEQKEYVKYIISNVINRLGDAVDSVAFTWMVYLLTQSAAWSAIIFGMNRIPTVFLQPVAGAIVENMNKKRVMILTDVLRGICVGLVAVLFMTEQLTPYSLLVITIVISSAEAFRNPASTAFLPKILERQYYEYGISLNTSLCTIVELIGLGIAGVIIAVGGIPAAIFIDMITFLASACIITIIRIRGKEKTFEKTKVNLETTLKGLKEGAIYVKNNKIIINFILITFLTNALLVPFNSLQAPLISQVYQQGEMMLSAIGITFSIGMLCGSVIYPILAQKISNKILINLGGALFGMYTIGLILIEPLKNIEFVLYGLVSIMTILAGIGISLMISVLNIGFVKNVDEEYMARAGAILSSVAIAAMPVVSLLVSILVKIISVQIIFTVTGILAIGIFLSFTFNKKLIL